jgi:hypothetical protein
MKVKVAAYLFLTASICNSYAQTVFIKGHGSAQCGEYLADRQRDNNSFTGVRTRIFIEWVNGYISAYNSFASRTQITSKDIPSETIIAFIDKYCRDNPLKPVVGAVDCLLSNYGGPNFPHCQ